jgi:hypothetical protein
MNLKHVMAHGFRGSIALKKSCRHAELVSASTVPRRAKPSEAREHQSLIADPSLGGLVDAETRSA